MFGNQQDTVLVGWKKAVVTTDAKSCRGRIKSVGEVCHDKKTVFGMIPIFRKCDGHLSRATSIESGTSTLAIFSGRLVT
jgi:hypothetical protein